MKAIDLHVHSTFSDGTCTPTELVEEAVALGLRGFALTDHDNINGLKEAIEAASKYDLELVPGIEISSAYLGKDVHILGHFINPNAPELNAHLEEFIRSREERNKEIVRRLNGFGFDFTYEDVLKEFPDSVMTRMHFAVFLHKKGFISSIKEGFERYLGDNRPCNVPREKITPFKAVELILSAGGLPTLAHPILYHFSDAVLEELVVKLKEAGLVGIETIYSTYSTSEERQIRTLAAKYDLITTGGSDYHGKNKPDISLAVGRGRLFIPEDILDRLHDKYLENFSTHKKNLMFFDMDGTLLNNEKQISPKTRQALEQAIEAGHVFSISTGRPLSSILKLVDSLDLKKYNPLIAAFNGGLIYDTGTGTFLEKKLMDRDLAAKIISIAKKEGFHFHSYSDTEVLSERETEEIKFYSNYVNLPYRIVEDALANTPEPYKVIIMNLSNPDSLHPLREQIMAECGDSIQCLFSNRNFLEILPIGSGKGAAIDSMCQILGIPKENTYAFADAENDITMLMEAAHGVCMQNGYGEAKKVADYITFETNNHDGLVPFIEKLMQ